MGHWKKRKLKKKRFKIKKKSTLCSVFSIQTWFQNNLPRHCYSKGKCFKQTPTYSEAKWSKVSNTHTLKILLYANYVHDEEALQDSEVPF